MMKEYTYICMRVSLAVVLFWLMSGQDLPQQLSRRALVWSSVLSLSYLWSHGSGQVAESLPMNDCSKSRSVALLLETGVVGMN